MLIHRGLYYKYGCLTTYSGNNDWYFTWYNAAQLVEYTYLGSFNPSISTNYFNGIKFYLSWENKYSGSQSSINFWKILIVEMTLNF